MRGGCERGEKELKRHGGEIIGMEEEYGTGISDIHGRRLCRRRLSECGRCADGRC